MCQESCSWQRRFGRDPATGTMEGRAEVCGIPLQDWAVSSEAKLGHDEVLEPGSYRSEGLTADAAPDLERLGNGVGNGRMDGRCLVNRDQGNCGGGVTEERVCVCVSISLGEREIKLAVQSHDSPTSHQSSSLLLSCMSIPTPPDSLLALDDNFKNEGKWRMMAFCNQVLYILTIWVTRSLSSALHAPTPREQKYFQSPAISQNGVSSLLCKCSLWRVEK